jgi:hypothetical protein
MRKKINVSSPGDRTPFKDLTNIGTLQFNSKEKIFCFLLIANYQESIPLSTNRLTEVMMKIKMANIILQVIIFY